MRKKKPKKNKSERITLKVAKHKVCSFELGDIRKLSLERENHVFNDFIAALSSFPMGLEHNFAGLMACQSLICTTEHILRTEWDLNQIDVRNTGVLAKHNHNEKYKELWQKELEEYKAIFTEQYSKAKTALGNRFESIWLEAVSSHNECGRANLDNSNGTSYSFIIPKMNPDGTHDPVSDKDGPWNRIE